MVKKIEYRLTFIEWLSVINKPRVLRIETKDYIYESVNYEYFFITKYNK